jgi:hypothetical protein
MERINELQPEGTHVGGSADNRTVNDTLESAEALVLRLIAGAGFKFDPLVVLA